MQPTVASCISPQQVREPGPESREESQTYRCAKRTINTGRESHTGAGAVGALALRLSAVSPASRVV